MSNEVLLSITAAIVSVATIAGTAWGAWLSYKLAALKADQDRNAHASKARYDRLNETCDEQTVMLNKLQGTAEKVSNDLEDTKSGVEKLSK